MTIFKEFFPQELRDEIEAKCGPISWRKLQWDISGTKPVFVKYAQARAIDHLLKCGEISFQTMYEDFSLGDGSPVPDADLYLAISLLVQDDTISGKHPYAEGWEHSEKYKLA